MNQCETCDAEAWLEYQCKGATIMLCIECARLAQHHHVSSIIKSHVLRIIHLGHTRGF